MPVSIVRRYAALAIVAATVLAIAVAVGPYVVTAAMPTPAGSSLTLQSSSPGLRSEATRVELVVGSSEARYRAQEVLAGIGANEAVGRTSNVSGTIQIEGDGAVTPDRSRIIVDLTSLQSDRTTRDNYIKRNTLQVDQFPNAVFVVMSAPDLPVPLPTSGTAAFLLKGDLTVHGVTQPAEWQATATFADREVTGTATTKVLMTDFGMTPPKVGSVVSIEDAVTLELDVKGTVAPSLADMLADPS